MSLYQLGAYVAGWSKANGVEDKPAPPTDEEFEEMLAASAARDMGKGRVNGANRSAT